MKENNLSINSNKTKFIKFNTRHDENRAFIVSVIVNNTVIESVNGIEFLGFHVRMITLHGIAILMLFKRRFQRIYVS